MEWYIVEPIPIKRRVRVSRKNARTYVDDKTAADINRVRASYKGVMHEGAVAVLVEAFRPSAKAKRKSEPFTVKPDVDNVLKAVMDGLTGVAYADDKQVTLAVVRKLDREPSFVGEFARYAVVPAEEALRRIEGIWS